MKLVLTINAGDETTLGGFNEALEILNEYGTCKAAYEDHGITFCWETSDYICNIILTMPTEIAVMSAGGKYSEMPSEEITAWQNASALDEAWVEIHARLTRVLGHDAKIPTSLDEALVVL